MQSATRSRSRRNVLSSVRRWLQRRSQSRANADARAARIRAEESAKSAQSFEQCRELLLNFCSGRRGRLVIWRRAMELAQTAAEKAWLNNNRP